MIPIIQGGTQANYTGNVLEKFIEDRLVERGYDNVLQAKFDTATYLEQPIYSTRYFTGKNIYGLEQYCDFIIYHPKRWAQCLIIEAKWQQTRGSVDEKFPYLVLNIEQTYGRPTIIVMDGGGYRKGAESWLRKQTGKGNLKEVLSMAEFQKWVNQGNL